METFFALIDMSIRPLRVPKAEVKDNRWEGYLVATTVNELVDLMEREGLVTIKKGQQNENR